MRLPRPRSCQDARWRHRDRIAGKLCNQLIYNDIFSSLLFSCYLLTTHWWLQRLQATRIHCGRFADSPSTAPASSTRIAP